jgi:hypothetical protein
MIKGKIIWFSKPSPSENSLRPDYNFIVFNHFAKNYFAINFWFLILPCQDAGN